MTPKEKPDQMSKLDQYFLGKKIKQNKNKNKVEEGEIYVAFTVAAIVIGKPKTSLKIEFSIMRSQA